MHRHSLQMLGCPPDRHNMFSVNDSKKMTKNWVQKRTLGIPYPTVLNEMPGRCKGRYTESRRAIAAPEPGICASASNTDADTQADANLKNARLS